MPTEREQAAQSQLILGLRFFGQIGDGDEVPNGLENIDIDTCYHIG